MRVTQNSTTLNYLRNLNDVQSRINEDQIKISTGQDILNISDAPDRFVNAKQLTDYINRNSVYQSTIQTSLNEMQSVDSQLSSISDTLTQIRNSAIDSTSTSNNANEAEIASTIKGSLQDLVNDANLEFNGQFVFSGTKTTEASMSPPTSPAANSMPFELVQGTASDSNPSGLSVVFKGNMNDRSVSTNANTKDVINIKADEMFGAQGTDLFNNIIGLYNTLAYKSDGTARTSTDALTQDDLTKINDYQKQISTYTDNVNNASAKNGTRINRFTAINDQLTSENTRLDSFRSQLQDTDIAKTSIDLTKESTALQYSLQVGTHLINQTLFDFLS